MKIDNLNLKFESEDEMLEFTQHAFALAETYFGMYQLAANDLTERMRNDTTWKENGAEIPPDLIRYFEISKTSLLTSQFFFDLLKVLPRIPGATYDERWFEFCSDAPEEKAS